MKDKDVFFFSLEETVKKEKVKRKYQKTLRFTDVFRGLRNDALGTHGLISTVLFSATYIIAINSAVYSCPAGIYLFKVNK